MVAGTLIIIGAGGFGREVYAYTKDANDCGWSQEIAGFLDDRPSALSSFPGYPPILGGLDAIPNFVGKVFIIAVADPMSRQSIAAQVEQWGAELVTLIHPLAYVSTTAEIGQGCVICPYAMVGAHARIGDNCSLNVYSSVGHDAVIGPNTVISPYTAITGAVTVGKSCLTGTRVTVLPGVAIGDGSRVAAGSVVTADAEAGSLLSGSPAKGRVIFNANPT